MSFNQSMKTFITLIFLTSFPLLAATIKVASVNYRISGGSKLEASLKRIEEFAIASKAQGADYLLLPELINFDFLPLNPPDEETKKELDLIAKSAPDFERGLKEISLKHKINLLGSSMIVKEKNHFLNRALYISDAGKVEYQDKLHPVPWERKMGFIGNPKHKIKLFKDKNFSFSILICYDAEFPTVSASLIKDKPEVIFVPSQTDSIYGLSRVKLTSAARAVEHMAYVLMTGISGDPNAPWHAYVGQNFLFTPQNSHFPAELQSGPNNQEALSVFELDLEKLRTTRKDANQIYPARDAR